MDDRQLSYLPVADLAFDWRNPRLPSRVATSGDDEILRWLLNEGSLVELMGSIGSQGYFPGEPLLVAREDGSHVVVEGNRRLAACKLLLSPDSAPTKKRSVAAIVDEAKVIPEIVPCLVFEAREEILGFLGYRHITGIREWDPQAKARYLRQLYEHEFEESREREDSLRQVARRIGSRSDYVARLLTSLALFEAIADRDFFGIPDLDAESLQFSLLTVGINRPQMVRFLGIDSAGAFEISGLNPDNLEKFCKWVYQEDAQGRTQLGESRNMTKLAAVVADDAALALLEEGASLEQAWLLATDPQEDLTIRLERASGEVRAVQRMLERGHDPSASFMHQLDALQQILDEIRELV